MEFDGAFGNLQGGGDVAVVHAFCHEAEDIVLPVAEVGQLHAGGEFGGDRGGNVALSAADGTDDFEQFLAGGVFEQIGFGSGAESFVDMLVGVVDGEHDNASVGGGGADGGDGFDSVGDGHSQVEEGDIGLMFLEQVDRFLSVVGLGYHAHVGLVVDDGDESFADDGMVVGDEDANVGRSRRGGDHGGLENG